MKKTLEILNNLVSEKIIDGYAIGGAVAAIYYTEPAETGDLDVFITFPQDQLIVSPEKIYSALAKKGYSTFEKEGIIIEGLPVQFLPAAKPLLLEAYQNAISKTIAGIETKVIGFEHLAVIMLDTNRPKDKIRLSQFAVSPKLDRAKFENILKRHNLFQKWEQFQIKYLDDPEI